MGPDEKREQIYSLDPRNPRSISAFALNILRRPETGIIANWLDSL
jgi:hypothetical protein